MAQQKFGDQSPHVGRFQTLHQYIHQSTIDMTGATGDKVLIPVVHDKIEILEMGYYNIGTPGAVTTPGVFQLDKIPANNGTRVNKINANAEITFDSAATIYSIDYVDLNLNASGTPVAGEPSRPTAVKGDILIFDLTTQGVAGTQNVRPYILYRERTA